MGFKIMDLGLLMSHGLQNAMTDPDKDNNIMNL